MEPVPEIPSLELLLEQERWVRALARRLVGHDSDAEDVTQSAMAVALERPPRAAHSAPVLRAWLGQVVRRIVSGSRRADARRLARETDAARGEALPSASEIHAREDERRIVVESLLALHEPFRTTLLLRYYRGLEPVEIARAMDVPDSTVRNRLARGLAQLRHRLEARQGSDWRASCALLAGPLVPASKGALIGKGVLMGVNMKMAISCSVVALAGLAWWGLRGNGTQGPKPARLELATAQKPSNETDEPAKDASNSSAIRAQVEQDPVGASASAPVANDPVGILVYGSVRQSDGQATRGRARVRLLSSTGHSLEQLTDEKGAFAFTSLSEGQWRLFALLTGYAECVLPLELAATQPVRRADLLLASRLQIPVRFLAPDQARLSEAVRSAQGDSTTFLGMWLSVLATEQAQRSAVTVRTLGYLHRSALGEYHDAGLGYTGAPQASSGTGESSGDGLLIVEDRFPMYISATWRGIVLDCQRHEHAPKEIVFTIAPERLLELVGGFKVRLVDAEDHSPIQRSNVVLHQLEQDLHMGIGPDGILEVPRLPPGLLELRAEPWGHEPLREFIDVQPGMVTDLGVRELARTTPCIVDVVDEGGKALPEVQFRYAEGSTNPLDAGSVTRTAFTTDSLGKLKCQLGSRPRWIVPHDPDWTAPPLRLGGSGQRIVLQHGSELVVVIGSALQVDAVLVARDASGTRVVAEDAGAGALIRTRLMPGRYELELVGPEGSLLTKSIELGDKPLVVDLAP